MASPVVASVVENSTPTAGTNHTINLPALSANDLLFIVLDKGSTAATVNAHASLTELLDENLANGLYIAYRWCDGSEPASYTLVSSATTRTASLAYRITGAENPATQAPQIGTTSSGSSATPDPPASATPPSSKDYLFIAFYGAAGEEADDDTWSDTPPTNYTPSPPRTKACGIAGTNLGGMIAAAERALTTGVAENPGTFAKDVSAAWRAQTIMIHPTSSSPQTVAVTGRTSASSYGTVTAVAGNVNVSVAGRTCVSSFGTVTPAAGAVTVTVSGRTSQSTYGAVTASNAGETVAVAGRTSSSSYGTITAAPGNVSVAVTGRTSPSSYGAVTPLPGGTIREVAGRTSTSSYGTPTILTGGVTVQVGGHESGSSYGTIDTGGIASTTLLIPHRRRRGH